MSLEVEIPQQKNSAETLGEGGEQGEVGDHGHGPTPRQAGS